MRTRAVIEQAKGMLMADKQISAEEAFSLLTRMSPRPTRSFATSPAKWSSAERPPKPSPPHRPARATGDESDEAS